MTFTLFQNKKLASAILACSNLNLFHGNDLPYQKAIEHVKGKILFEDPSPESLACFLAGPMLDSAEMADAVCNEAVSWFQRLKRMSEDSIRGAWPDVWAMVVDYPITTSPASTTSTANRKGH